MISEFVREQKRYTQEDLCKLLRCSGHEVLPFIRKLKEFGVLKAVKASEVQRDMTDLMEEDIEILPVEIDENEYYYVFTFVGVIVIAGRVLKCFPKYLLSSNNPQKEIRQVIKVLEKYNTKKQIVKILNENNEEKTFNLLAVLLYLLQDYYENGIYSNIEDIIETNGEGEILWDKTINETFMMLSGERPYYVELQTKKRIKDEYDFFKRLHECVLTKASNELKDADLLDIFEITEVDLSEERLSDFGDKDYILYRIEKELGTQFNTRKQLVLKTLYAYISHSGSLYDSESFSLFGTNCFNLVWEGICAEIFDNQLEKTLGSLMLSVPLKSGYDSKQRLIDLIEKPFWSATKRYAAGTLIPDIVTISHTEKGTYFVILDAKYYNTRLKAGFPPEQQPGIESITKQYLYQLAYKKFIEDHGFQSVENYFLLPSEKTSVVDGGEVEIKMLADLGLRNIKVRFLPADMVYDYYLKGKRMSVDDLF